MRPRPISSFANASPSLLPSEKRTGIPHRHPPPASPTGMAHRHGAPVGLKPNYELLGFSPTTNGAPASLPY
ncbi:MAG: hypothetical protein KME26_30995 [Oscillatoria princeps RMCB-10]|nr:hypothetical protein [Oscillatoria princeps RMCB-10]